MALLLEEIVVEFLAIAAAFVALACLIYLLALTFLERRDQRLLAEAHVREYAARRGLRQQRLRPETLRRPPSWTVHTQG
jgi:hypothetical protein